MNAFRLPAIILISMLIVLSLGQNLALQIDLSSDSRYSLSETTKSQLKQLEAPLRIDLFLDGALPTIYKDYR